MSLKNQDNDVFKSYFKNLKQMTIIINGYSQKTQPYYLK